MTKPCNAARRSSHASIGSYLITRMCAPDAGVSRVFIGEKHGTHKKGIPIMATIPSVDETARRILKAAVFRLKLRGGQSAPFGAFRASAQQEGVDSQDLADGLQHANIRGWLALDGSSVTLSEAGYSAAGNDATPHDALRDIAQQARNVAAVIHQPAHGEPGQFQTSVGSLKSEGPDGALRDIESQLLAIANKIDAYLPN
jgi:hypothetical protein